MPIPKVLLLSFILMLFFNGRPFADLKDCDMLKVKAEIYSDTKGAKIEIKIEDGESPFKYLFYKKTGHLISSDYNSNTVEGLSKGKYFCTVVDKKNCKKTIEIEIK